jgi:hypothetical protein
LSLLPFLLPVQPDQISRVTDRSRFTHHPHPERTHAHARTARSFACWGASLSQPSSFEAPSYPRAQPTAQRASHLAKAKQSSLLHRLHRDRNGRQLAACANENARKARQRTGNQSHARRKRGAGRAGYYSPQFPLGHTPLHVCCMPLAAVRRPYCTYCLLLLLVSEPPPRPPFDRVPAHALRVQSGWPRWRELAHAPVRDIPIVLRAAALSWCDL